MPTTYAIPNGRTVMDVSLWTGTNASLAISNSDSGTTGFQPDFIWIKSRSNANSHLLGDSVRGYNKYLFSDYVGAEETATAGTGITAFNSNGFQLGSETSTGGSCNGGGKTYVGWQWKANGGTTTTNTNGTITSTVQANTTVGFSIITYTGTGSAATVGHGLGATPSLIIVKERSTSRDWAAWVTGLTGGQTMYLDSNSGIASDTAVWNNTLPTSSVFSMSTSTYTNQSTGTYVAYCWTPIAGFSAFGSYTGNGSTDGPFVYTGFKPKFLMYKRTDSAGSWFMVDSTRNSYNTANYWLQSNTSDVEQTDDAIDLNSNGFKIRTTGTGTNANGGSYVYMVWAENPFKYATAR